MNSSICGQTAKVASTATPLLSDSSHILGMVETPVVPCTGLISWDSSDSSALCSLSSLLNGDMTLEAYNAQRCDDALDSLTFRE